MAQEQIMLPSHGIIQLRELEDLDATIAQETNAEWERLSQDLQVLREEFGDVSRLTRLQDDNIDTIEKNTTCADHNTEEGVVELRKVHLLTHARSQKTDAT